MKLYLICMIRNEIDVLPSFLGHIDALFDRGCLVDHLSSDGSEILLKEYAAARPDWEYRSIRTPAYIQAEISSELLKRGFDQGADAVFFLDADEFIGNIDRPALESAIADLQKNQCIGHLRWRNCVPADYGIAFSLDNPAWICDPSIHKKLVVPSWLYHRYGRQLAVNQGNHSLKLPRENLPTAKMFGEILHFPIRSRQQFIRKIFTSYVSQAMRPEKIIAPHIQYLFDALMSGDLSPDILNFLTANYGMRIPIEPLAADGLKQRGYMLGLPPVTRKTLGFSSVAESNNHVIDFGDLAHYRHG